MRASSEKWYDKGIRYALYALPIIIPVIFLPDFYTVFSAPKLLALRVITLFIMVCWGAKVFVEEKFACRRGWLNVALLSYAIVSVLTTIFSVAFYSSIYGAQGRFLGIFTLLNLLLIPLFLWNFLPKKKDLITLLKISVAVASGLALYGIAQFFGIFQEGLNWNINPSERVFGTIGHGNHFGAYLGMHILLGLSLLPTIKKNWRKGALIIGIIAQLVTLSLTASRGALGATLIAGTIAIIILVIKKRESVRKIIVKGLLPVFILVSIIATAVIVLGQDLKSMPIIDRTISTIESMQEGKIPDRFSWWLSSIEMIKERPLLGWGVSTYRDVYNQFRRTDYETAEEGDMQDHITPEAAHNEYLNIAATQGIIGLLAFLSLIALIFWRMDKVLFAQKESDLFYPVLGVKAALMVYLLQVFISFGVIATLAMFYLFLGIGFTLSDDKAQKIRKKKEFIVKGPTKYILILFLLSGIGVAAIGTYREGMAEIHYKQALIEAQRGDIEKSLDQFENMIISKPLDYAYHQAYGDFGLKYAKIPGLDENTKIELIRKAILSYENAILINDLHPSTFYNLGVAYMQIYARTGDTLYYERAAYNFDEAVAKAVNNPLYPYQSGKAFMAIEDQQSRQKALAFFEKALEIRSPFRDTQPLIEKIKSAIEEGEKSQPQSDQ